MIRFPWLGFALLLSLPANATEQPDGRAILKMAREAAGGDRWANARALLLKGRAVFWGKTGVAPASAPDSYTMHREFDPGRIAAHGAEGKLRIEIRDQGQRVSVIGYDGENTWTDKGLVPKAEADRIWASNFGFGIIRHALKPGFKAERLADGNVEGHPVWMVRLADPSGTETLFGIDKKSHAIRLAGFATPRGWHTRTYDHFFRPKSAPWWLQAGKVTLTYNGVKQNEIWWDSAEIDGAIDARLFAAP